MNGIKNERMKSLNVMFLCDGTIVHECVWDSFKFPITMGHAISSDGMHGLEFTQVETAGKVILKI